MRKTIFLSAAALALAGCGNEQSAEERAAAEQNVTTEVVATNDTTAIDAATGEDANMAADVAFMPEIDDGLDGNTATPRPGSDETEPVRPRTRTPQRRKPPAAAAAADDDEDEAPEGNTL